MDNELQTASAVYTEEQRDSAKQCGTAADVQLAGK